MRDEFSIQFVARVTGINPHTIRAWEKRYSVVEPDRDDVGRRVYSQVDIDRLKKISDLVSLGNKISDVAKLRGEDLDSLWIRYSKEIGKAPKAVTSIEIDLNTTLKNLVFALEHYKLDVISHELEKIRNQLSIRDFTLSILSPLLQEIGKQVEHGHLNVAQERALNSILSFHIGSFLYKNYDFKKNASSKIILASPEGEKDEFITLISALLCCHHGHNFYYLGSDLPLEALEQAIKQIGPTSVILGLSTAVNSMPRGYYGKYVDFLLKEMPQSTSLLVSGVPKNFFGENSRVQIMPSILKLDTLLGES